MRYSNFTTILNVIEEYLERNRGKSKLRMEPKEIIKQININQLLNHEKDQQYLFCEIIILLTVLSSRNNTFIDKMLRSDENLGQFYLRISDKYILNSEEREISENESSSKKYWLNYEKLYKIHRDLISEKYKLQEKIQQQQIDINSLTENYINADRKFIELEFKYKEKCEELEYIRNSNKVSIDSQQELLDYTLKINNLINVIDEQKMIIENLKKDHDYTIKLLNEQISNHQDQLRDSKEKNSELKDLKEVNEKLKKKIKELNILKMKESECNDLQGTINSKVEMIKILQDDNQNYINQLKGKNKELQEEKEKFRELDFQKIKLENEIVELTIKLKEFENTPLDLNKSLTESVLNGFTLDKMIVNESFVVDKINQNNKRLNSYELEIENLKKEISEKTEKINNLYSERENVLGQLIKIKSDYRNLFNEKEKILKEKEKISLELEKIGLDKKRVDLDSSEKKKLEDDLLASEEKLKKLMNENLNCIKENEYSKNEKSNLINEFENVKAENLNLNKELENKKNEKKINEKVENHDKNFEKMEKKYKLKLAELKRELKIANALAVKQPSPISIEKFDSLDKEYQNLMLTLQHREEFIKTLETKIKSLEIENKNYNRNLKEAIENFEIDMEKRTEDFEFIKRSYEEQKTRVNKEHDLISSSLYDLAVQFMTLKNELQKKDNKNKNKK